MTTPPSALTVGLLATTGIAVGAGTLLVVQAAPGLSLAGPSLPGHLALLGAGWLAIGVGLGAWRRRSGDPFGPLLAAAGAAWLLGEWANPGSGSPAVFTAGLVLYAACPPLVAHASVVYPTPLSESPLLRATLGSAYVASLLLVGAGPAMFFDPASQGCHSCPSNLVLVADLPGVARFLEGAGAMLALGALAALAAVLAVRLLRTTPAARSAMAPVAIPAALFLLAAVVMYARALLRGHAGIGPDERGLWWVQAVALAAVSLGVVAARVRMRRARQALAELVVEMGSSPAGGLRAALGAALGDPELMIAYPTGAGSQVDAHGDPVAAVAPPGRATTAVVREGEVIAVLVHDADLLGDPRLVEEVAAAARLGLENERLRAETNAQLAALRRSRLRIVEAGDTERRRLERDLHDGAQQSLVGVALALRLLRLRRGAMLDAVASARLAAAEIEMGAAIDDLRRLARGVHPAVLTDEGLAAAVSALGEERPVQADLAGMAGRRFPQAVESAAYHVVAESARTGAVTVAMAADDRSLVVDVTAGRAPDGLVGLEDRVGALDGAVQVTPGPGGIVSLRAEIPCG